MHSVMQSQMLLILGWAGKRALITVVISTAVCLRLFISNIYKLGRTTVRFAVPVYADWQRFLLLILKWLAGLALVQHYI